MGVDIRVRRFAQSDAERTLMHTIDKGNRAPLANALSNYYKKLKADERSITKEDLEELLRVAFHISIRQASRKLDLLDKYQAFKGKHLYNMRETHPNTATLKHLHAQARQELGEVAEPHGNLQNLLASYRNEYEALSRQIHAYGGNSDDPEVLEMAHALTWHVNSLDNSNAPTLNESTIPMHVDFSKGDGWAFDSFLYRESQYYHFKNKNPVGYLSRKGRVQVTFIAKDVAVVTSVTGIDRRVPAPFIVLSAAKPMSQDLTGYSYIVESVKPGGEWEPAMVTFRR